MIQLLPRLLPFALVTAFAFAPAPDLTATWKIDGNVEGVPVVETCILTQTDATLAGTCKDTLATRTVTGTVAEKMITFSHPSEYQGQPLVLTFAGNLDETGKLSGTIDVSPLGYQGVFSATKAASPAPAPTPAP